MIVLKVIKNQDNSFHSSIFDENLSIIEENTFADNFEFNFYIQALQEKLQFPKIFLIVHDLKNNSVDLNVTEKQEVFL